jgi:hypothetical protein
MSHSFTVIFSSALEVRKYLQNKIPAIAKFKVSSQLAILKPLEQSTIRDIEQIFIVKVSACDRARVREVLAGSNVFLDKKPIKVTPNGRNSPGISPDFQPSLPHG